MDSIDPLQYACNDLSRSSRSEKNRTSVSSYIALELLAQPGEGHRAQSSYPEARRLLQGELQGQGPLPQEASLVLQNQPRDPKSPDALASPCLLDRWPQASGGPQGLRKVGKAGGSPWGS